MPLQNIHEQLRRVIEEDYVWVVDDFLPDLDFFLKLTGQDRFYRNGNVTYPGQILDLTATEVSPLKSLFQRQLNISEVGHMARIRRTRETDNGTQKTLIHTDQNFIQVLIYLSLPGLRPETQGTFFLQHTYLKEKKLTDDATSAIIHRYQMLYADNFFDKWHCWFKVEPKINRAIIFDGHLFHCGPPHLSGGGEDPRLTLEFSILKSALKQCLGIKK